jgi:hypothetical protein
MLRQSRSYEIYEAVLDRGVTTPEEFSSYLRERRPQADGCRSPARVAGRPFVGGPPADQGGLDRELEGGSSSRTVASSASASQRARNRGL